MLNNVLLKCQFPHLYLQFDGHFFLPVCCFSLPPLVWSGVPGQLKTNSTETGCRKCLTAQGWKTHHCRFLQFFFRFFGTCYDVNKEKYMFIWCSKLPSCNKILNFKLKKKKKKKGVNKLYMCVSGFFGITASCSFTVFYSRQQSLFTSLHLNFRPTFLINVLYFGKKISDATQ